MAAAILTQDRLRELLHYDPETGLLTWRNDAGARGRIKAGTTAGSVGHHGHVVVNIGGSYYYGHRLAYLHMTGEWPSHKIDHKNGVRHDNRWDNLRNVSQQVNTQNRRGPPRGKKSGLPMGVSIDRRDGAYRADITTDGRTRSLGRYKTPEEAHAAYLEAKRRLHEGCTI